MKKVVVVLSIILTGTQFATAQTTSDKIDSTHSGSFYMGYSQALVVVDGVVYSDGISNSFQKPVSTYFYTTDGLLKRKPEPDINPEDIKDVKVLSGTDAKLYYGDKAANGAVIITTKKADK